LIVAAIVQLIIGVVQHGAEGMVDGLSIFMAIAIITFVTAGNNYIKEKQFQELQKKQDESTCLVIRSGIQSTRSTEDLVVGDLIIVSYGMTVPADCILITSSGVSCDEGALTGEPDELKKFHVSPENYEFNPNPFLLRSTLCVSGEGRALVVAVGPKTLSGRADAILNIENELTPLQMKLETIANQIGKMGVFVAILTFIAMVCRLLFDVFLFNPGQPDISGTIINQVLTAFIIAVTVIVVAVPEGLPLAVTISLAFSVSKMYKENNLVRKLHASETMGGANEICTDKTGTLTQNRMTVMALYAEDIITSGSEDKGLLNRSICDTLAQSVLWNCSAFVETELDGSKICKGNVTEVGMVNYLMKSGVDVEKYISEKEGKIEMQIPFDSKRKR
jgi:Ca2+ transporting ATPase